MTTEPILQAERASVESLIREDMAVADLALENVLPILRHLLGSESHTLFSDEITGRVRSMLHDLAMQLLTTLAEAGESTDSRKEAEAGADKLADALADQAGLVAHLHGLACEWQLAERLQSRLSLDPVLPPLLQSLIASTDQDTASLAMKLLAAQARFAQNIRRGDLPMSELPDDHLKAALETMRAQVGAQDPKADMLAGVVAQAAGAGFDQSRSRCGIMHLLLSGLGSEAHSALDVTNAGVGLFITALAKGAGISRETAILATSDTQLSRLALVLLACGAKPALVEQQFLSIHPEVTLPEGIKTLPADKAAAILAQSRFGG